MDQPVPTPLKDLSFKEENIELEQIVRSLESGDLELEIALEKYNRGVELLNDLRERLAQAEQRVQVLLDASAAVVPDTTAAPSTAFIDE
ncbi:exodeoxyribonuclease VII small subunit [Atopobium fossor]|uniref:exodeoxyribonuclease VII small subunit n=1 Tax=Atopobium fossor TaxID=39487 RepID=UPI0003F5370D|nr:exodeoxyribonuclease VII small subunit [Atopobium fossor]